MEPQLITALVFPCASGVGQEIFFALQHHKDIRLLGSNSGQTNPGRYLWRDRYIGGAPPMRETDQCVAWLRDVVRAHSVSCIFPAYDDAQVWLAAHAEEIGASIITSPAATTEVCRSKKRTYEVLNNVVRCPAIFSASDPPSLPFPIFIKPECGEGSKGCFRVNSASELATLLTPEHIILEYLPGDEFTVDCFTDAEGVLRFCGARKRTITRAGLSVLSEAEYDTAGEFSAMGSGINASMKLIGAWFFQAKQAQGGELCLMEVAPRIPGAMALHRALGINFPALSVYAHLGMRTDIVAPSFRGVSCCKVYTNNFEVPALENEPLQALYIDLDDTLLLPRLHPIVTTPLELQANPDVIAVVYEARAAGIPIHLITRHRGDVTKTLQHVAVHRGLFSSVHVLADGEMKFAQITERPAVLLDDSFRERAGAVRAGVHALDVDALELLRDIIRAAGRHARALKKEGIEEQRH
jgi:hypothetical protein